MSTQFVKNTDKPNADSYLWQLGNNWKVSQKTGDVYSAVDAITDEQLGTTLAYIVETGNLDVIELEDGGGFFVPSKFVDQKTGKVTWSVFAFENRVKANKKLEDGKKFANYQPKTTTQPQGQQTISKPVTASTISPKSSTLTSTDPRAEFQILTKNTITSFTDPKPVDLENQEYIATLQTDGYSFLPKSLVEKNFWEQKIYDEGGAEVGTKLIFLMGRIINVKIPDNN